jgi:hypothetical protein
LKPASRSARAGIIAPELFAEFLITVNDSQTFPDASLGRETFAPFAGDFEKMERLRVDFDLPYFLLGLGLKAQARYDPGF